MMKRRKTAWSGLAIVRKQTDRSVFAITQKQTNRLAFAVTWMRAGYPGQKESGRMISSAERSKRMEQRWRLPLLLAVLWLLLLWARPVTAVAATAKNARITDCRLLSSSTLQVTATCDPAAVAGQKCYLFALPFDGEKISSGMKPLCSVAKAQTMTFTAKIRKAERQSSLYCRYVIAERSGGRYRSISPYRYLSNPNAAAKQSYAFPTTASKKGLQVCDTMMEDAVELNVQHAVLNINLAELLATGNMRNKAQAIPYSYEGKTFWFRRGVIGSYDSQLKTLKLSNTVVSAVLLLGYREGLTGLIHPKANRRGYAYYAWNMKDEDALLTFRAMLSFLAKRYCSKKAKYGRIANWIVGNEVDNPADWNYSGNMALTPYIDNYAKEFRLVYSAVSSVWANARVYISLSHLWNTRVSGSFTGRETLQAFASAISARGYIPWNLAYHPYSSPLTEPKFWENKNKQLTAALTSPIINMGNLSVLTDYIRTTYGRSTRIILSEQGFTSVQSGKDVQKEQSAAIAYSYLITEADDMVDAFIMNRHVDHTVEVAQGLNLGLWTTSGTEWADRKKDSWNVFKYMDTSLSEKFTNAALPVIRVKRWEDAVKNYSPELAKKVDLTEGSAQIVPRYKKKAKVAAKWKCYGAGKRVIKKKGVFTVTHAPERNPNSHWGFIQSFGKPLNMNAHSCFYTKLSLSGSQAGKARVKLRFYSGQNIFECAQVIPRGKRVCLKADLSGWAFRGAITRIILAVEPVKGGWKQSAQLSMVRPVLGD